MAVDSASFVGKGIPPPAPEDFDETFVRIGRLECEAHYRAERLIVDAWLRERGRLRLFAERAKQVKANEGARLDRGDVNRILEAAFPVPDSRHISPVIAQRAAHHLRICRNGGWIISPVGNGLWRLGLKVVSAAELVEVATKNGFRANLPGEPDTKLD